MFYAYSDTRTYSHHICIWREIKRHLQHLYKHSPYSTFIKKNMRSAHFLTTRSHIWTNIYTINLAVVLNKHVYLLKIKLLIQQIQSQDLFLVYVRQHIFSSTRMDNMRMSIDQNCGYPSNTYFHEYQRYWVICLYWTEMHTGYETLCP